MKKYLKKAVGVLTVLLCAFALSGVTDVFAASTYKVNETVKFHQTEARSMLSYVNDFRTKGDAWCWNEDNKTKTENIKRDALQYDYGLEQIAKQRAAEIVVKFDHQRPDGTTWHDVTASDGSQSWAENIAKRQKSAEAAFNAWKEEDKDYEHQGHRRNMLGSSYTAIGIACVEVDGIRYWVQEFGFDPTSVTDPGADDSKQDVTIDVAADQVASTSLNYTGKDYNLGIGQSVTLPTVKQNVTLNDGETLTSNVTTEWRVSDSSVATISGNKLTGVKKGTTTLTAEVTDSNGKTQTITSKVTVAPEGIEINATNFPDENFRNYVSENFDKDNDGYLQKSERDAVTEINVSSLEVKDLTGIQYFTELTKLNSWGSPVTTLDVSKNTALTDLNCKDNKLKKLNVTNNIALKKLDCSYNQLTELDISKNTALTDLDCGFNKLTSIDVTNNSKLDALLCYNNRLTSIDTTHNSKLSYFDCANNKLSNLNLRNNSNLQQLDCENNQLAQIDFATKNKLGRIYCNDNQLTNLDFSNSPKLAELKCENNKLTQLTIGNNPNIYYICCSSNKLTQLDVGQLTGLIGLDCKNNQIKNLDLNKKNDLTTFDCRNNQILSLDLSANKKLEILKEDNTAGVQLLSGQTRIVNAKLQNGKYIVNLKSYDSTLDPSKVTITDAAGGKWDAEAGTLTFDDNPNDKKVTYTYSTGYSNSTKYPEYKNLSATLTIQAAHTHTFGAWKTTKKPTCTIAGTEERSCTVCGYKETRKINALGHNYSTSWSKDSKQHWHACTRGDAKKDAAAHSFSTWKTTKKATCTTAGTEERSCTVCGYKETRKINALGHNYSTTWSKDSKQHWHACTRGDAKKDTAPHKFGEWKTTKPATKRTKGTQERVCVCGQKETRSINFSYTMYPRIYGATRYQTAINTANTLKSKMGGGKFGAAVIAYGENYPDALSGTYLANVKKAPLLLANAKDANTEANTINYVKSNVRAGGKVYLLGGPGLVSSKLESTLRSQGYSVVRLYGSDRYQTNVKILNEAGVKNGQDLLVCTGENYPDALSTSALGKPILLVNNNQLTNNQRTILKGKNVYIIGGTAAISQNTMNTIRGINSKVSRINGIDRYDTSAKIAKQFCKNPTTAVLAYGQNFPDGLAGGTLAYKVNAPLLLATSSSVGNKSIANYVDSTQINKMYVLGGPGLISDNAAESVLRFDK